jgi:hypothetical protein
MKKYIFPLFILLTPVAAMAAVSVNTVWEARSTNGLDTSGGGSFVFGN